MKVPSIIKKIAGDLFRYFFKGARVDAALTWAGRMRLNEGDAYVSPGAQPMEYEPGKFAYNAQDIVRRWSVTTRCKLKLKNNSSQPAYNLVIVNYRETFDECKAIPKLLSLQPNEEIELDTAFRQIHFAHSGVEADKLPAIPSEKENAILNIEYQNERGTKMRTKFYVSLAQSRNEYFY